MDTPDTIDGKLRALLIACDEGDRDAVWDHLEGLLDLTARRNAGLPNARAVVSQLCAEGFHSVTVRDQP